MLVRFNHVGFDQTNSYRVDFLAGGLVVHTLTLSATTAVPIPAQPTRYDLPIPVAQRPVHGVYAVQLTALNIFGASPTSQPSTEVPTGTPPPAPTLVSLVIS